MFSTSFDLFLPPSRPIGASTSTVTHVTRLHLGAQVLARYCYICNKHAPSACLVAAGLPTCRATIPSVTSSVCPSTHPSNPGSVPDAISLSRARLRAPVTRAALRISSYLPEYVLLQCLRTRMSGGDPYLYDSV
eukprot:38231-Chlamydomonas_euryale.AAC.10